MIASAASALPVSEREAASAGMAAVNESVPNLYAFKRSYLTSLPSAPGKRGVIGIPLSLGMYELLPMWHTIFTKLGFQVMVSEMSTRKTYEKGQFSIPSDTACYPAKIMHGHVQELIEKGVDAIFYPCLTYNVNEKAGDNFYNCPVVAYYSELLQGICRKGARGGRKGHPLRP